MKITIQSLEEWLDQGKMAEVEAICEGVLKKNPGGISGADGDAWAEQRVICQVFLAQADLTRKRKVESWHLFFQSLLNESHKSHLDLNHFDPQTKGWILGQSHSGMGMIAVFEQNLEKAIPCFLASEEAFSGIGNIRGVVKVRIRRMMATRLAGRTEEALLLCLQSLQEPAFQGRPVDEGVLLSSGGSLLRELGRNKESLKYLESAVRLAKQLPPGNSQAYCYYQYGTGLLEEGRTSEALKWLTRSCELQRVTDPCARFGCQVDILKAYLKLQKHTEAFATLADLDANRLKEIDPHDRLECEIWALKLYQAVYLPELGLKRPLICETPAEGVGPSPAALASYHSARESLVWLQNRISRSKTFRGGESPSHRPTVQCVWEGSKLWVCRLHPGIPDVKLLSFYKNACAGRLVQYMLSQMRLGHFSWKRSHYLNAVSEEFDYETARKAAARLFLQLVELQVVQATTEGFALCLGVLWIDLPQE